jgi:hypothetical protein
MRDLFLMPIYRPFAPSKLDYSAASTDAVFASVTMPGVLSGSTAFIVQISPSGSKVTGPSPLRRHNQVVSCRQRDKSRNDVVPKLRLLTELVTNDGLD